MYISLFIQTYSGFDNSIVCRVFNYFISYYSVTVPAVCYMCSRHIFLRLLWYFCGIFI